MFADTSCGSELDVIQQHAARLLCDVEVRSCCWLALPGVLHVRESDRRER